MSRRIHWALYEGDRIHGRLPVHSGLAVLAAGFVLVYAYDRKAWQWRPAFLSLRTHLTAGAVGSLVMVWMGNVA